MKNKKNNLDNDNYSSFSEFLLQNNIVKSEPGIHPDMIVDVFKVKNVCEGMTLSGVYISNIIENKCSGFVVIKKDTFYKNIPSRDTILSPGQKIRINNKDKKVENLVDNVNIVKIFLPETNSYHFLSNKKDYIYVNNIQIVCENDKKTLDII